MKIAQLASQGTLPVISVKMFSGSWEIDERKYEIIICGLNNTAFKRSIQETFCMTLHQIYAKLSKNENATQKTIDWPVCRPPEGWAPNPPPPPSPRACNLRHPGRETGPP